jgi:hypothetical protein
MNLFNTADKRTILFNEMAFRQRFTVSASNHARKMHSFFNPSIELKGMKACIKMVKKELKTIKFTRDIEMCYNGCFVFENDETICPKCTTPRNKDKPVYIKMVSLEDKAVNLLVCDETREMIESYRSSLHNDGTYKDIFSGEIFEHLDVEKNLFQRKHDIILGLCIDAFTSKTSSQSMVLVTAINFSLPPSVR